MTERRIILPTISNCRDLGSLETADGHHIKMNHLLRSAELSEASQEDLLIMHNQHRLNCVIDLRTNMEYDQRPDASIKQIENLHRPVIHDPSEGITHENKNSGHRSDIPIDMAGTYENIMRNPRLLKNLSVIINTIMSHDYSSGSVLWHCTEGKDRCGITAMLVLLALGVDYSVIAEDYLITNEVNEAKANAYYDYLITIRRSEEEAQAVYNAFIAKKEYLDRSYAVICESEDIYHFFNDKLGITRETIEAFRNTVLE
ncbi:MAG: tyrosine-protein phosphatase [Erysipelotrichaceae bacterium]|nr:tyrosine-protein phosphatase [Erysipelotrichaceae bacterium]